MVKIHQQPDDRIIPPHLVCDNQVLVKMIARITAYSTIYPNMTMEAEWDCLAQILLTIKALNTMAPTIDHIKGHQDESTPYEELPLLAQLNCDADCFANTFLRNHPKIIHSTAHQFPAGECLLQLRVGTITRDIKHECCHARNLPAYQEYVTKKSKWFHECVFDTIDWEAHGRALK